jgi:leader peptidase (prepilin peptidase) / N-methyltransferase
VPAIISAVLAGLAALTLTGRMRALATTDSRWLTSKTHVALAAVGGVGAAYLARTWAELLAFAVLTVAFSMLIIIDLAELRLPDKLVLPLYPVMLGLLALVAALEGLWGNLGRAAAGGTALLVAYFALALVHPAGMGLGDVKLAGVLGIFLGWLGWPHAVLGTFAAFVLNALIALVLLAVRRTTLSSAVPFGPSMILGAAAGAAWGPLVFPGLG